MNDLLVVGGKLALICVIAALALGVVNAVTEPAIAQVKARQLAEALDYVSLGGTLGEPTGVEANKVVTEYYPLDSNRDGTYDSFVLGLTGQGYGGDLKILATFSDAGEVEAVSLMDDQETPGLGKAAERPEYMQKYIGYGADTPIPTSKQMLSQKDADAVSGASITFMGIADALVAGSDFVKALGGGS